MMITITYTKTGHKIADEDTEDWVQRNIIHPFKLDKTSNIDIQIANEITLYAIRVAVLKGKLPYDQVVIIHNNKQSSLNKDARFIDDIGISAMDKFLNQLLGI